MQRPQTDVGESDHRHARIARRSVYEAHDPLESPVPEIGTPGSVSRGWKRDDGSRTEAPRESAGTATGP